MAEVRRVRTVNLVCGFQHEDERPPAGSLPASCQGCGAPLWVSPAGREVLATHRRVAVLCVHCGAFDAATAPGQNTVVPVPHAEEFVSGKRVRQAVDMVAKAIGRASSMRRNRG